MTFDWQGWVSQEFNHNHPSKPPLSASVMRLSKVTINLTLYETTFLFANAAMERTGVKIKLVLRERQMRPFLFFSL
jgi:hypothetical protein